MLNIDKIDNLIGYLILNEDGAVLNSGGDLENDERIGPIINSLVHLSGSVDPQAFPAHSAQKISIDFEEFNYTICLSNKKLYVVKRRTVPTTSLPSGSTESSKDLIGL